MEYNCVVCEVLALRSFGQGHRSTSLLQGHEKQLVSVHCLCTVCAAPLHATMIWAGNVSLSCMNEFNEITLKVFEFDKFLLYLVEIHI